jgi:SAM-dependent methyltransferase
MDLKEEDILGNKISDHWYYTAKGHAMRDFIAGIKVNEILDVGAGSGVFSRQLTEIGFCSKATCVDPNYTEEKTEICNGKAINFVREAKDVDPELILMMDVLEHVSDDVDLLKSYTEKLAAGGHVFITVPAFEFMWSGHDVFLGHYRRYTIERVEELARKAGLVPIRSRYFFGSLFPAIAAVRITQKLLLRRGAMQPQSDLRLYPDWLNKMLVIVHDFERRTFFKVNKLCGLSVFCLCQKR